MIRWILIVVFFSSPQLRAEKEKELEDKHVIPSMDFDSGMAHSDSSKSSDPDIRLWRSYLRQSSSLLKLHRALTRVEQYHEYWPYWSLEEAQIKVLGNSFRRMIQAGKIYYDSESNPFRIVEDPLGEYFRITTTKTKEYGSIYMDQYLVPISNQSLMDKYKKTELFKQRYGTPSLGPGNAEPQSHFSYIETKDSKWITLKRDDIREALRNLNQEDHWIHVRGFAFEADSKIRVQQIQQLIWNDLHENEKQFILQYAREALNSYERVALGHLGLGSHDNRWASVFFGWLHQWIELNLNPSGDPWKLRLIDDIYPFLARRVNEYNSRFNKILRELSKQRIQQGVLKFDELREDPVHIGLSTISAKQNQIFWKQVQTLPREILDSHLRKKILRLAEFELDPQSLPLTSQIIEAWGPEIACSNLLANGFNQTTHN